MLLDFVNHLQVMNRLNWTPLSPVRGGLQDYVLHYFQTAVINYM